jgi:hypothetical protein
MPSRVVVQKCVISGSDAVGGSLNGLNTLSLPRYYGIAEFVNTYV